MYISETTIHQIVKQSSKQRRLEEAAAYNSDWRLSLNFKIDFYLLVNYLISIDLYLLSF